MAIGIHLNEICHKVMLLNSHDFSTFSYLIKKHLNVLAPRCVADIFFYEEVAFQSMISVYSEDVDDECFFVFVKACELVLDELEVHGSCALPSFRTEDNLRLMKRVFSELLTDLNNDPRVLSRNIK